MMQASDLCIRPATAQDAAALLNIYAYYVQNTAISFEYEVPTEADFIGRIENTQKHYPWLVAVENGAPVGYAYAGALNPRAAYLHAAELSIYIRRDCRGRHIGAALLGALEAQLKQQGITNLYACVAYAEQEDAHLTHASLHFHHAMGFQTVGQLHRCGEKFGKLYDICWLEKMI